MRRSKPVILFSALSVLAVLAATTSTQAFAPPAASLGVLKPLSAWKVGTVSAQGASYCVMVNQFDKRSTLAFARNPEGYGSVAIDFNGSYFNPGEDYGVALKVDNGELHKFIARASSARSIIVQVGTDDKFYNSLSGNGSLQVGLPMLDMTFALPKFSDSYVSLVNCAANLNNDGPKTAAMPVPGVEKSTLSRVAVTDTGSLTAQETGMDLREKALASRGAELQKERESLQAQMDAVQKSKENNELKAALDAARAKLAAVQSEKENLKGKFNAVLTENTTLHPGKEKAEAELAAARAFESELGTLIISLKQQKEELAIAKDAQEKQAKILQAALASKEQELASVKAVSGTGSKALADARAELASMTLTHVSELEKLQAQLREKDMQLEKQMAENESMHKSATVYASRAEDELAQSKQEIAQLKSQLSFMEKNKSGLTARLEEQDRQNKQLISGLQSELDQSRQQMSMLESQMMSVALQKDQLAAQLDAQNRQNKVLQSALSAKDPTAAPKPQTTAAAPQATTPAAPANPDGLAAVTPSSGDAPDISRKRKFLPVFSALPARDVPKLRIPVSSEERAAPAPHADDWETIVVQ